jgi:hypothetical protein
MEPKDKYASIIELTNEDVLVLSKAFSVYEADAKKQLSFIVELDSFARLKEMLREIGVSRTIKIEDYDALLIFIHYTTYFKNSESVMEIVHESIALIKEEIDKTFKEKEPKVYFSPYEKLILFKLINASIEGAEKFGLDTEKLYSTKILLELKTLLKAGDTLEFKEEFSLWYFAIVNSTDFIRYKFPVVFEYPETVEDSVLISLLDKGNKIRKLLSERNDAKQIFKFNLLEVEKEFTSLNTLLCQREKDKDADTKS